MYGIELPDLIRFFMQVSAAVVGAASLWGFVFLHRKNRDLAKIVFRIFLAGLVAFLASWFFVYSFYTAQNAFAHEGIVLEVTSNYVAQGLNLTWPIVFLIASLGLLFFTLAGRRKGDLFLKYGKALFFSEFLLISAFLSFSIFSGSFDRDQLFHSLHGWHSIFTLGTIITIDALYMMTLKNSDLKRVLYRFFPIMSAVIWVGLGIDFASVGLIIGEPVINITNAFLFNQTVVAIIVINGALLSGRMNNFLISLIKSDKVHNLSRKMGFVFGLSGSVSIVSWLTITFIDFHEITLSYVQLFAIYMAAISVAFVCSLLIEARILRTKTA